MLEKGTGLAGISSAMLGAREVVVTDLPYALANLQANIDINQRGGSMAHIHVRPLDWFNVSADDVVGSNDGFRVGR